MHFSIIPSYGFQALDHSKELHTVVGRETEAFRHFLAYSGTLEDDPVASRAGVAA
jgi:hypothetical protein